MSSDDDTGPSVYNLFLSSVAVFVLYAIMQGILPSVNYFLFGVIVVGGIDVIFKGPHGTIKKTMSGLHCPPFMIVDTQASWKIAPSRKFHTHCE